MEARRQMGFRFALARAAGASSTWVLKRVFHRPAANFPGKAGLCLDSRLIADLRPRVRKGTVVVVGTNGKTTVTNMLADAFEKAGESVVCNRTGANLDSGVATALMHAEGADWGVFESDELWLARTLPQLHPDFAVLLNLFRDQLDRVGEIDRTQAAIVEALSSSPETTLIYNADDPLCHAIASRVANERISFGIGEELGLAQNMVSDAGMCQQCDALLDYSWRQYGQLGVYRCPRCGFHRPAPEYSAREVHLSAEKAAFTICHGFGPTRLEVPFSGTYMLYNALAVFAAADCCGLPHPCVERAIRSFNPRNGRLQQYVIGGRRILLNLAKNPTGFNQNLRIVLADPGPKAVAFFINDKEADGHDVSWLWDVDFQELAAANDIAVYAGGIRRNDMQVRLKYANLNAQLVDGAADFLARADAALPQASCYLIANYTALPDVKSELDHMQDGGRRNSSSPFPFIWHHETGRSPFMASGQPSREAAEDLPGRSGKRETGKSPQVVKPLERPPLEPGTATEGSFPKPSANARPLPTSDEKLVIAHLYPELLNLYGDGGNVTVIAQRARWRGVQVEIVRVGHGRKADLANADIVFLGGGPDREQHLASLALIGQAGAFRDYIEDDGVLLAICGGYQMLGREWLLGDENVPGLGIVDMTTGRAEGGSRNRLVGNIVLNSPLARKPVVGYENHAGRTFLGSRCIPFGTVTGRHGKGNNDSDGVDGVLYRNLVGTYLHGPLLAKNPDVADWLIERALARRAAKEGRPAATLAPLDDAYERAANDSMCAKLGIS